MKLFTNICLFLLVLFLSRCTSASRKENTITISGAFALYPMVVQWAEEFKKENPEVRFNISAGGAGKGMADALTGTADLGMVSRDIMPEEVEKGAWWISLTSDAVVATMNAENPYAEQIRKRGLSHDEITSVYINGTITFWEQLFGLSSKTSISVYTRSDACGAAATWAKYLGGQQEDLVGIGIFGDPAIAQAVVNDINGVGYNNTIFVYDIKTGKKRPGIEVIPIDLNDNGMIDKEEDFYTDFNSVLGAISSGDYPSPPARELYFVSKGIPKKEVVRDFIFWILTTGQKFVKEAGYVPLGEQKVKVAIQNLNYGS
jgi:phosphate transport system substrate-binding protein